MSNAILREIRLLRLDLGRHSLVDSENFAAMDKKLDALSTKVGGLTIKMSVVWSLGGGALALFGAWLLQHLPARG